MFNDTQSIFLLLLNYDHNDINVIIHDSQGEMGHFTGTQSSISTLSYSLAQKLFVGFLTSGVKTYQSIILKGNFIHQRSYK